MRFLASTLLADALCVNSAGEMLASCSGDKAVRIWARQQPGSDAWSCAAILEEAQMRTIRCVAWSPDGRCLATASFDATTAIWEVQAQPSPPFIASYCRETQAWAFWSPKARPPAG